MKLTAKVQLQPTAYHDNLLHQTLARVNEACNFLAATALAANIRSQEQLHRALYHEVKVQFDLTAQMALRSILRVADLHRQGRLREGMFPPDGPISYDAKVLTWRLDRQVLSIWTIAGRKIVPFACGQRQLQLLTQQRGESELITFQEQFYLFSQCEVEELSQADFYGVWE